MQSFLLEQECPFGIESMAISKAAKPKDYGLFGIIVALISLVVTIIGLPIMLLTWIEPHLENDQKNEISLEVGNQLKDPIAKMEDANSHLAKIEGTLDELKPFIHDVISHQFENVAKLPAQAIGERLPALANLFAIAKDQGIKMNPEVATSLSAKLLKINSNAPDYWPLLGNFVSVRSPERNLAEGLPDCVDSRPKPSEIPTSMSDSSSWSHFKIMPSIYTNCRFTLDSERDSQLLALVMKSGSPLIAFQHCVIVYKGGEVNLTFIWDKTPMVITFVNRITGQMSQLPARMTSPALQFIDCQLDFSIEKIPPPTGQKTTRILLAQNSTSLTLSGQ
jgi:hypothetical protein